MEKQQQPAPISVRLPEALDKELRETAEREHRTLNGQITLIVEWFFRTARKEEK